MRISDEELMDRLAKLADEEKLTDQESEVVFICLRIVEKRAKAKSEVIKSLRTALHHAGHI